MEDIKGRLNCENYFSTENQMEYFGTSQIKSFLECESKALAEIKCEYVRPSTTALLVGSYVDAHFSSELDLFRAQNPEIYTKSGTLKSEFKQAEEIIARIERDPMMMQFLSGQQQVVKDGCIDGHKFKIKMDSYHPGKLIADLKVMRDMEPVWKNGRKRHFIDAWGYMFQAAIYQCIEGTGLPFYLVVATKQTEPDIRIIQIAQPVIDAAMEIIKTNIQRFADIKKGLVEPSKCETCDWCKSERVLKEIELYTSEEE